MVCKDDGLFATKTSVKLKNMLLIAKGSRTGPKRYGQRAIA